MTQRTPPTAAQRLVAEGLGTAFLLAAIVGSAIMASRLAGGNEALFLLPNALAIGAMLVVLIFMLGPISGAHFNPAVTLAFRLTGALETPMAAAYIAVQLLGGAIGVVVAHLMFETSVIASAATLRSGAGQWFSEAVATFGLVLTILLTVRVRPTVVAVSVGLYIAAACWFTASTSFANPAVTVARMLTDSAAGIRLADAPAFVLVQLAMAPVAVWVTDFLAPRSSTVEDPTTD
jgi:glycerol uptake facilitator-like aquaporin